MDDVGREIAAATQEEERRKKEEELASLTALTSDRDLYGGTDKDEYATSIPAIDAIVDGVESESSRKLASYTAAPKSLLKEVPRADEDDNSLGFRQRAKIIDLEDDYRIRRMNRVLSPDRHDALKPIAKKKEEAEETAKAEKEAGGASPKRRNRRDDEAPVAKKAKSTSDWDLLDAAPGIGRWEKENQKVRRITALEEAAAPYGIESFDSVLKPLLKGIRSHRGKVLAAFLEAIGFIIPLTDAMRATYYTKEVMIVLIREFQSPDEEMKKIVLKVVKQCVGTAGVESDYIRNDILPEFFKNFWVRRMALDKQLLVETTVEIANKVGVTDIVSRLVEDLKDENEPYRRMVMETIEKVITNLGASDIDARLVELLIDGILYAFQEQTSDDDDANVMMLNGFGAVVNALGQRVKPYLPQICGTIKWRLNSKSAKVRQQAADLISRIALVMKQCQEEQLLGHLGVVLYEYFEEECPEVLGSILGALKAIVNVIVVTKMTPPIKDLLPRLTPILKNRHEKVRGNCIDLVRRISDCGEELNLL